MKLVSKCWLWRFDIVVERSSKQVVDTCNVNSLNVQKQVIQIVFLGHKGNYGMTIYSLLIKVKIKCDFSMSLLNLIHVGVRSIISDVCSSLYAVLSPSIGA